MGLSILISCKLLSFACRSDIVTEEAQINLLTSKFDVCAVVPDVAGECKRSYSWRSGG